ncbi:MAG: cytochrome bc complex cytochrome b subunit [Planctomycetes bacterium]|nr:cytochrome bc complex cytochrome b subunit [Planctomycetota bacterium]
MKAVKAWLDERVGLEAVSRFATAQLEKPVPRGLNYAFTLGTAAMVLFGTQVGSGILLAMNYSSSMEAAYASVQRITYDVPCGWLIRSIHVWGAHLMVLVVLLHMLRVFWTGGYKKPRELTWIFGCGLLLITLGFGFTGYLLPMDQVSYWGTMIGTEWPGAMPGVGEALARALRGGEEVSSGTLARFFILHVLLLPAALCGLIGAHVYLVRRLGIATRQPVDVEHNGGYKRLMEREGVPFSRHVYREVTTVFVLLSLLVTLAVAFPAGLGAAATPDQTPPGVKPNWYFLPVFQLIKYCPKMAAMILVNALIVALFFLPFLDRNPRKEPRRRKFLMVATGVGLAATLAVGFLGFICEKRVGPVQFDTLGVPHWVEASVQPLIGSSVHSFQKCDAGTRSSNGRAVMSSLERREPRSSADATSSDGRTREQRNGGTGEPLRVEQP